MPVVVRMKAELKFLLIIRILTKQLTLQRHRLRNIVFIAGYILKGDKLIIA